MSIFLCGNTGFHNRGCEAIVSSTIQLLPYAAGDIYLTSFDPKTDASAAKRYGVNLLPYASYPSKVHRVVCGAIRKASPFKHCGFGYIQGPLFRRLRESDICLNIGGDVYCYGRPAVTLALDSFTHRHHIKNILWCCSIGKDALTKEILRDLQTYHYILARESLTFQNLTEAGLKNVLNCCDPAFFLQTEPVALPDGFQEGNTIGINLSPLVANEEDLCYQNVVTLIRYLLDHTDFHICLIPHVYTVEPAAQDYRLLRRLYEEYDTDRVSILDQEYRCEQLKFVISKCRFLIAARTHASIAAYSSCVPTLVLGYSVKSKGIAKDLFGDWQDYVLPFDELKTAYEVKDTFLRLMAREDEIRAMLAERLPAYRKTLPDAMKTAFSGLEEAGPNKLCRAELCTGCTACASSCPTNAISFQADREGFLRPVIDESLCVKCGTCSAVCPSLHRFQDAQRTPDAFAVQCGDESIRQKSSSGGAFTLLAQAVLNGGGAVVGAAFGPDWRVTHRICTSMEELAALRTAKYVQSDLTGLFPEIKRLLQQGTEVLFTGTPCQVDGLHAYLGEQRGKLICADLICHGVPSPAVWQAYCASKGELSQVRFRDKINGWKRHSLRFTHPDGTEEALDVTKDPYLKCFVSGHTLRPSCYLCPSKQLSRRSDLTLGDFWGVERVLPAMSDDRGTSLILVHSEKGARMLDRIRAHSTVAAVPFQAAIAGNGSYEKPVAFDRLRAPFFRAFRRYGAKFALHACSSSAAPFRILRGVIKKR